MRMFQCQGVAPLDYYMVCNGRRVEAGEPVIDGLLYHFVPRLVGGKGGFGSMLRALGAQIEKTTNREACRDLSGRRMRDVNNEKTLREWAAKKSEKDMHRERQKQERAERRRRLLEKGIPHQFDGAEFYEQKNKIAEDLEVALQEGLKKGCRKRVAHSDGAGPSKRAAPEWLGVNVTSSSSESEGDVSDCSTRVLPSHSFAHDLDLTADLAALPAQDSSSLAGYSTDPQTDAHVEFSVGEMDEVAGSNGVSKGALSSGDWPATRVLTPQGGEEFAGTMDLTQEYEEGKRRVREVMDTTGVKVTAIVDTEVDLMTFSAVSDLETLGLEFLKQQLQIRGLKCGGNLQERAKRLWAVRGKEPQEWDPKLKAKK